MIINALRARMGRQKSIKRKKEERKNAGNPTEKYTANGVWRRSRRGEQRIWRWRRNGCRTAFRTNRLNGKTSARNSDFIDFTRIGVVLFSIRFSRIIRFLGADSNVDWRDGRGGGRGQILGKITDKNGEFTVRVFTVFGRRIFVLF